MFRTNAADLFHFGDQVLRTGGVIGAGSELACGGRVVALSLQTTSEPPGVRGPKSQPSWDCGRITPRTLDGRRMGPANRVLKFG